MLPAFGPIAEAAASRVGGADALEARLPRSKSADELRAVPDDRYLSLMSLRVFRAGLKHSLVDARWPAFEEAFHGFEPRRLRAMSDEALEKLMGDKRLIRHWGKIKATRDNAAAVCALQDESGGFGSYLADWPGERVVGLWDDIAKRFSQMGGNSGAYFLRMAGKDTFVLTGDVTRALIHWRAAAEAPKGKKARAAVQEIFNGWAAETGRPLAQLSMILALSSE
jgi:3-methyladenine DNA glycosylase Tag